MTAVSSSVLVSSLSHVVLPVATRAAARLDKPADAQFAQALATAGDAPQASGVEDAAQAGKPAATVSASAKTVPKEELERQVHELQAKMDKLNPALAFVVDQDSGRTLLQLTDRATKEVILQYPTQAALQISKALDQFQKGQLLSKQA